MTKQAFFLWCCLGVAACQSSTAPGKKVQTTVPAHTWQPPAEGALVDKYEQRITEDKLNEKYFRVSVLATAGSDKGHFNLKLEYGFNIHEMEIDLPQWTAGTVLKPVLQAGTAPYHCILGFDTGDGQFHELYEIRGEGGDVHIKKIRGYYLTQQ